MEERITNPKSIDAEKIATEIRSGKHVILQFSEPCYQTPLLKTINELCIQWGPSIEVRFFGHYRDIFDASVIRHVPQVKALTIDCLEIKNPEVMFEIQGLRRFGFGVHRWSDGNILHSMDLSATERLFVGETASVKFDLSPLASCQALTELFIVGHTKGIETIANLPRLRLLSLGSIPSKRDLRFVSEITPLRRLVIILGGREHISEIDHSKLEELEILRVRGFKNFDNLTAFPSLKLLAVEDQIRLSKIALTPKNNFLKRLRIINCKNLAVVSGLEYASSLQQLRIFKTDVDIESILSQKLPSSLKAIAFYSTKRSENQKIRDRLNGLGYVEHEWQIAN